MKVKVTLTGGGTGGHLYPGLAIVEELGKRMNCHVQYIGTRHGVENQIIPDTGYQFNKIWMSGIHRGRIVANLLFPAKMMVSFFQALVLLILFRPDVVIGTGGYVSWPVLMAASFLRTPRYIQEQNKVPGLVTKVLAPLVSCVFLSFEISKQYFKKQGNLVVCGNPTRHLNQIRRSTDIFRQFKLNPSCITLFVFGGSQGARGINTAILSRIESLMKIQRLQLLWATGPKWYSDCVSGANPYQDRICVMPYIYDMGAAYAISDIILCRSGATTIAEITNIGKPAIYIPFPAAAGNHQQTNARVLADAGAAVMVLESEIASGKLDAVLMDLINHAEKRRVMAEAAKTFGHPDAAKKIADRIIQEIQA